MQIVAVAAPGPASAAERRRAADALTYLPGQLMDSIELQAARESSAGKRVSPAQLVATALGALTVDRVHESLRDAVEGAMRVAPDERWRRSFLDEAAEGTARILRAALADARTGEAWTVADALVDELDRATDVLYAAAAALVRPGSDEPA